MHCPYCNKKITAAYETCPFCVYVFDEGTRSRLSIYFGMKEELERINKVISSEIVPAVRKLTQSLGAYEKMLEEELAPPKSVETPPVALPPVFPRPSGAIPQAVSPPREERTSINPIRNLPDGFEVNLGQKWLLIIGIVTMIFGVGYFLKYSFEQGWVGPAGRVSMAYVWGIVFMIAGDYFRRRFADYGLYLIGGGIATLYFATFAGFQIYHLIDQATAFSVMVVITALAGALSIYYDTKWLAVLGLAGGFMTPLMLGTGQDNQIALMTYMTVLNVGILGIAFYKKWDLLTILGFAFTFLLYSSWFMHYYGTSKFWPSVIYLNIFFLVYSIVPFARQFVRAGKFEGIYIIAPNSLISFAFNFRMIREYASLEWVSIITITYAALFLVMASYLSKKGREEEGFIILIAKAALFLIISVPIIFSRHWITIFWTAQAVTLLWMSRKLPRKGLAIAAYVLLAAAIAKFMIYDYSFIFNIGGFGASYTYLLTPRLVTIFFLLAGVYAFARLTKGDSVKDNGISAYTGCMVTFGILLFTVANVEAAAFFQSYLVAARFAAVSVLWTIFSVVIMVLGFRDNSTILRKTAICLFTATLVKVFIYDMENISTPYRIISFIVLGLMLVGSSYLYHKFRDRLPEALSEEGGTEK